MLTVESTTERRGDMGPLPVMLNVQFFFRTPPNALLDATDLELLLKKGRWTFHRKIVVSKRRAFFVLVLIENCQYSMSECTRRYSECEKRYAPSRASKIRDLWSSTIAPSGTLSGVWICDLHYGQQPKDAEYSFNLLVIALNNPGYLVKTHHCGEPRHGCRARMD
jgi:hypothetical protein